MIKPLEIAREQLAGEGVGWLVMPQGFAGVARLTQQAWRRSGGRHEDVHIAKPVKLALPVAAPCSLRNGVEPGQGAINHREVQVYAGLDQLRADDPHGVPCSAGRDILAALFECGFDLSKHIASVLRAHQCRQVPATLGCALTNQCKQLARIGTPADDGQRGVVSGQFIGQIRPLPRGLQIRRQMDSHAFQCGIEPGHVIDDLGHVGGLEAAAQAAMRVCAGAGVEYRLRCGAQH